MPDTPSVSRSGIPIEPFRLAARSHLNSPQAHQDIRKSSAGPGMMLRHGAPKFRPGAAGKADARSTIGLLVREIMLICGRSRTGFAGTAAMTTRRRLRTLRPLWRPVQTSASCPDIHPEQASRRGATLLPLAHKGVTAVASMVSFKSGGRATGSENATSTPVLVFAWGRIIGPCSWPFSLRQLHWLVHRTAIAETSSRRRPEQRFGGRRWRDTGDGPMLDAQQFPASAPELDTLHSHSIEIKQSAVFDTVYCHGEPFRW